MDAALKVVDKFEFISDVIFYNYLGYSTANGNYHTYWGNHLGKIIVHTINFAKKSFQVSEVPNPLAASEKKINCFHKNGKFHLVSVDKNTNYLAIYQFSGATMETKKVDCSNFKFLNSNDETISFYDFIDGDSTYAYEVYFQPIFTNKFNYNTIIKAEKKKMYINPEELIFASDSHDSITQLLVIDLLKDNAIQKNITKVTSKPKDPATPFESNSTLVNKLFFISVSDNENLTITIKNSDDTTLHSFTISETAGQEYNNSDFYEEISKNRYKKQIDSQINYIRKSYAKSTYISCIYRDNNYHLTFGGVTFPLSQSFTGTAHIGLFGGAFNDLIEETNFESISSYSNKVVISAKSTLSANGFQATKGKTPETCFDKARYFMDYTASKNEELVCSFESQSNYVLVTKKHKDGLLNIYKF